LVLLIVGIAKVMATHLRAADIVAIHQTGKTYTIQLTVYTDAESVTDGSGHVDAGEAIIKVDGKNFTVNRSGVSNIGNNTFKNTYELTYEFSAFDQNYIISYRGELRNNGIVNMASPSDQEALYVETFVRVSSVFTNEATPQLLVDPIDLAAVSQTFTHNAGAWDADGDSLSYKLITPNTSQGINVSNYRFPDHPSFGNSNFSLNPISGTITWDSPQQPGEYNIAFMIEEWRNGARIGYVVRDMQILVIDSDNEAPQLILPKDTCLASGTLYQGDIIAFDPNDNTITLDFEGGLPFEGATHNPTRILNDSITSVMSWDIDCEHIRASPYFAVFKTEDNHLIKLSTTKNFAITVIGKAPQNLVSNPVNDSVQLTWDAYTCNKASNIKIWRSECDASGIDRDVCTSGVPSDWGFELIAQLSPDKTNFTDDNNGNGLTEGLKYCYLISVNFSVFKGGGESYASNLSCANMRLTSSLISSVSVDKTDKVNGEITIEWEAPLDLDAGTVSPYRYELFRGNTLIFSQTLSSLVSMTYTDTPLNTEENTYHYHVDLYDANHLLSSSIPTSSVFLDSKIRSNALDLNWDVANSWQNLDTLYDHVYQVTATNTILLDSIPATQFSYPIENLDNGTEYCFLVLKQYTVCHDSIKQVFSSWSNLHCNTPKDTIPPCSPTLSIINPLCAVFDATPPYINALNWIITCPEDVLEYELYYSTSEDGDFNQIATVTHPNLIFKHTELRTMVGCYKIRAVDEFGNKGKFSNTECQDNCEYYELPNIITPNDDGKNELFIPLPSPRFVKNVTFSVYNRWGDLVFTQSGDIDIKWNGENHSGAKLSDGVYYYEAIVEFDKLKKEEQTKIIKGWVTIVR